MPNSTAELLISIHRLSVEQYHRMIEWEVLTDDEPVLLEYASRTQNIIII